MSVRYAHGSSDNWSLDFLITPIGHSHSLSHHVAHSEGRFSTAKGLNIAFPARDRAGFTYTTSCHPVIELCRLGSISAPTSNCWISVSQKRRCVTKCTVSWMDVLAWCPICVHYFVDVKDATLSLVKSRQVIARTLDKLQKKRCKEFAEFKAHGEAAKHTYTLKHES